MRELTDYEVEQVSGGINPLSLIGYAGLTGAAVGAYNDVNGNLNSPNWSWGMFTGRVIQGGASGVLLGASALAAFTPGGMVAAVSLGGAAALIGGIGNTSVSTSSSSRGGGSH